jgi:hypothetical protein
MSGPWEDYAETPRTAPVAPVQGRELEPVAGSKVGAAYNNQWDRPATGPWQDYGPALPVVQSKDVGGREFGQAWTEGTGDLIKDAKIAGTFFLNPSEAARVDVIRKNIPSAEFARDENGKLLLRASAKDPWSYINAPGFSAADAVDMGSQGAQFIAGGEVKGPTMLARMGSAALRGGGISVAQDVASGALGSEQGVDPFRAGANALFSGLAEPVAAGVNAVASPVVRKVAALVPQRTQNALATVAQAVPGIGGYFRDQAAQATSRNALAEFGIPTTVGQETGDFGQIAFEQAAARGARGEGAEKVMRGFYDDQAGRVRSAGLGMAGTNAAGGDLQSAGALVQGGVRQAEAAAKRGVDAAYGAVRNTDATMTAPTLAELPGRIGKALEDEFITPEVMGSLNPSTRAILGELDRLAGGASRAHAGTQPNVAQSLEAGIPMGGAGSPPKFQVAELERVRKAMNAKLATAQGEDKAALSIAKREFDGWFDDAVDQALIEGDSAAVELLKKARQANADYRRTFGGGRGKQEAADRMMQKLVSENANETDAVNLLFGRAKLSGTGDTVEVVKRIKTASGGKGDAWNGLREGAVLRLMSRLDRNAGAGSTNINYKALADDWNEALEGPGKPLMREMFSPEELAQMVRFRNVLRKLTPPEGSVNRSGSGYEAARALQQAWGATVGKIPGLNTAAQAFGNAGNASKATSAISGVVPRPALPVAAAGYGLAAPVGSLPARPEDQP